MVDLLIKPTVLDGALMAKALTPVSTRNPAKLVVHRRLVVDAVTAARQREFADTARTAGMLSRARTAARRARRGPGHPR
jgi:hypothetical protein